MVLEFKSPTCRVLYSVPNELMSLLQELTCMVYLSCKVKDVETAQVPYPEYVDGFSAMV